MNSQKPYDPKETQMTREYPREGNVEHFRGARDQFEDAIAWLSSSGAAELSHSALEERLENEGRELMRKLLQSHLDLRAVREERFPEVMGSDGYVRTHVRESGRRLMSILGEVFVARLQYGQRELSSLFPGDAALNLPEETYSHGLRRVAAFHASTSSYQITKECIEMHTGGKIPPRQIEQLLRRAAVDFDTFYEENIATGPEETNDLLILSLDGKGIVMRKEYLREETKKKAEQSSHKIDKHLSPGEKRNRKRMATVAAVYRIQEFVRTPEEVMAELRRTEDEERKKERPRAENKRVRASVEKSAEVVTQEVFDEAERRDPEHKRTWVCLVDGDKNQIDRVKREAKRRGIEILMVLDLIHVLEYLWKAAWCFYEHGDRAAQSWVRKQALRILEGKSSSVAGGIRRSATKLKIPAKKRKGVDECAKYLLNKKELLHYDDYLAFGLPIGTGVIEGACRHLIRDRMELTGARWGVPGAEAVLRLRALRTMGDFEKYWTFHLEQEHERNHRQRYVQRPRKIAA